MQFFEHQDQARGRTTLLVTLFLIAVFGLVGIATALTHWALIAQLRPGDALSPNHWQYVSSAGLGVATVIFLGAVYRIAQLRHGGSKVAEGLGGTLIVPSTTDLLERRAINVVEEMALAAGLPVPPVYLLRNEPGLNAFAAGWSPDDAVIGITQGTLEGLNREQLQGVIAHEFSHILNRDCALNMRLLGVLNGIVVLSLIGRVLMRGGSGGSDRRSKGAGQLMLVGVVLWLLGSFGVLLARLIQAAVSRQREFLADASAVQFTRNPNGIAAALATIGARGSALHSPRGGEASHMLIGEPSAHFLDSLASHPPLPQRIRRILPAWDGDFASLSGPRTASQHGLEQTRGAAPLSLDDEDERLLEAVLLPGAAGAAGGAPSAEAGAASSFRQPLTDTDTGPAPVLSRGAQLLATLPPALRQAAAEPFSARALVVACVLDDRRENRERQADLLQVDPVLNGEVARIYGLLPQAPAGAQLSLFDLALGTLAALSEPQKKRLYALLTGMQAALWDQAYHQYCLSALALRHLDPHGALRGVRPVLIKDAVETTLGVLAMQGHDSPQQAAAAFAVGASQMGKRGSHLTLPNPSTLDVPALDAAFATLLKLPTTTKANLLAAAEAVARHDGVVRPREAELLRAMATCLGVATHTSVPTAS